MTRREGALLLAAVNQTKDDVRQLANVAQQALLSTAGKSGSETTTLGNHPRNGKAEAKSVDVKNLAADALGLQVSIEMLFFL